MDAEVTGLTVDARKRLLEVTKRIGRGATWAHRLVFRAGLAVYTTSLREGAPPALLEQRILAEEESLAVDEIRALGDAAALAKALAEQAKSARRPAGMVPLTLYSVDGASVVADVLALPWQTWPELYLWGERFFVRRADGRYCEAAGVAAVVEPLPAARVGDSADIPFERRAANIIAAVDGLRRDGHLKDSTIPTVSPEPAPAQDPPAGA